MRVEILEEKMDTGKFDRIKRLLEERILVLDGAMGSLIQCECSDHNHTEKEESKLPDILVRENPELIKNIHRQYLEAGADIIETDSFNSNRFSLSDYGLEKEAYNLSKEAAGLARQIADQYMENHGGEKFVAGSVGPTKHLLSLAENDSELHFDTFVEAYKDQISGLLDGGADIILLETVFDTLTVKTALYAINQLEEERGYRIPVMVSATVANSSGRILSGQTIEAFYASVNRSNLISVGLNCGFGSADVLPYIERLAAVAETAVSVYPNAGLPDDCGEYNEDAATFTNNLKEILEKRLVNIVGGCCGTTPEHIRQLKQLVKGYAPRPIPEKKHSLVLSNMEYSELGNSKELVQVGERTNVAGSAKFARLIREKNFEEALEIAVKQVEGGARIIDVCMDDGLEDSVANMKQFLALLNNNPETGSVPVMIDSSNWDVILAALKRSQGKSIVNSISLKDGEEEFLRRAREIKRLGAAVVVMLFDEEGQAETFEHKCRTAERAYRLLIKEGFDPSDIVFDPNVLTVGSGLKDKDLTALDFIKATKWIKENLPYVSVSGGISNLSFAFRGNNPLRHAMHTAFIYHASKAGLDMAIVNPGMLSLYDEIDPELLEAIEDLLLWRREDAVTRLLGLAEEMKNETGDRVETAATEEVEISLEEKIKKAIAKGKDKDIETLMKEALKDRKPIDIIEGLLMPSMKEVGEKFGEGKMFLPQVIKSAQVMKKAVTELEPYMDSENTGAGNENLIIATVKGDVHDIGKNIVGLVVGCNGYNVIDLGVRVETSKIADEAEKNNPKAILLSGLISPSLNEMTKVCEELERRGIKIPVIIGGAATSELHTAVKIAPAYSGDVFYSADASANLRILNSLSDEYSAENRKRQEKLREKYNSSRQSQNEDKADIKGAASKKRIQPKVITPTCMEREVFVNLLIEEVEKYIDWDWVATSLELDRNRKTEEQPREEPKEKLILDARKMLSTIKETKGLRLEGVVQIFKARSDGNDIVITGTDKGEYRLPMLRAEKGSDAGMSVADFVSKGNDYVALFAVTSGIGLEKFSKELEEKNDYYSAFLAKLIADRLAEAFAQWIHEHISVETWGFAKKNAKGCRIAFGYPAAPDHTLKRDVFNLLDVTKDTGMRLTETSMITPSESVCGMIFSDGEYINIGKIGPAQQKDYARKRNITLEELGHFIPNNI